MCHLLAHVGHGFAFFECDYLLRLHHLHWRINHFGKDHHHLNQVDTAAYVSSESLNPLHHPRQSRAANYLTCHVVKVLKVLKSCHLRDFDLSCLLMHLTIPTLIGQKKYPWVRQNLNHLYLKMRVFNQSY